MSTNELFERYFQEAAKRLAQGKTSGIGGSIDPTRSYSVLGQGAQPKAPDSGVESGWSLGQGFIDLLSSGSYFTAGVGQGIMNAGQSFAKGDVFGGLGNLNPLISGGRGVVERRTWSQNLQDMGVSEADSAGWGLGLDIALDPFWLIPGGAIAAGVKGTTRGAVAAAGASRAGVQFSRGAFQEASQRLKDLRPMMPNTKETVERLSPLRNVNTEPVKDLFPRGSKASAFSGTGIKNLYEGIKQGNVENYAEWAALRRVEKANKAVRKDFKRDTTAYTEKFQEKFDINPQDLLAGVVPAAAKVADDVIQGTTRAAEKPNFEQEVPDVAKEASEAVERATEVQTSSRAVDSLEKDASAVAEATDSVIEEAGAATVKSVNARAREQLGPARSQYMESRGLGKPGLDVDALAKIKTSPLANDIAVAYDRLVSDPTNPEVVAAYAKLSEEVEDQFKYMTDELGIKVKFVDEDPYQVKNADGENVTDSRLFMEDILNNKQLLVYKTADDQIHPILSKDINDKFRAVHDFFGHAASGRGVWADGEEAAWVSHSLMFSPLARRAMTTETRGQNSWVNKYGRNPETGKYEKYAEQKAGLLPDAYTLLPSEYSAIENQISATNSLIGRTAAVLTSKNDILMDDLGVVAQPMRGYQYNEADFATIKAARDKITDPQFVKPGSPAHETTLKTLSAIKNRIAGGTRLTNISEDLIKFAEDLDEQSVAAVQRVLNTPTDATELLDMAAKAEGRVLELPKPFKPINWEPKAGYGKPDFKVEDIQRYFPEDPILADPKMLDIAIGVAPATAVRAMKGETKQQALARKQALIWQDFRSRNEALISDATTAQKADWDATNNIPESDLFMQSTAGLVGLGKLPMGIPNGAVFSMRGRPMVTMAKMLEGIQSMIIREPLRMVRGTGGFETMILADIKKRPRVAAKDDTLAPMFDEDEVLTFATSKVTGATFKFIDASGKKIPSVTQKILDGQGIPAGAKLVADNDLAKQLFTRLNELGRTRPELQIDRIPPVIKKWFETKLDSAINAVKGRNVRVSRSVDQMDEGQIAVLARQLMNETPAVKSFADAEMFIANYDDAIKALAKKPKKKIFVKTEDLSPTRGARKQKIERDLRTGAPIPSGENFARTVNFGKMEVDDADMTLLTREGAQYTGRASGRNKLNRTYEPQLQNGPQQLASVANVAKAIDTIAGAITSKELAASPEQAKLLGRILGELGKKMAPDASPQQIFNEFQKNAKLLYEDMVTGIESAAKREAVLTAAPRAFSKSIEENMAIIEAIEKTDPGELQRKVMQFTEDAVWQADEACRANTIASRSAPGQFLENVIRGE